LKNHFNQIEFSWMFNIFFQNFFVTWGKKNKNWKFQHFWKKIKIVWKTAKVVIGYIYTIKSQYTHHLSLLQMMSQPTHKRKKRFWVLAFGVCEKETHTHTQYTHTSCGKKECLLTQHSFDGWKWTKWTLIHNTLVFCLFDHFACKMGLQTSTASIKNGCQ